MGFENQVRVCNSCKSSLTEEEYVFDEHCYFLHVKLIAIIWCICIFRLVSLATSYDASRHSIMHMDMDEERQILVTAGTDRMIKVSTKENF